MSIKQAIEALEVAQDALDISQSLQESAKSNHHPKTLAAYQRVRAALAALRSMQQGEPVAYSVTCNGKHVKNVFAYEEQANEKMLNMNMHYPQDKRAVVPLFAIPPTAPVPQGEPDVADIIAGALPTSRAHAYELMRQALKDATPHTEAVRMSEAGMYRKKPVVIEAFQMTRERRQDNKEWPEWLNRAWNMTWPEPGAVSCEDFPTSDGTDRLVIATLEGVHTVSFGDWIIKGVKGEIYPCKPDIFEATYEQATAARLGVKMGDV